LLCPTAIESRIFRAVDFVVAVAEELSTVGARVEDFVPEDRGKLTKPILSGLLAGAASAVATALVDASWLVVQAGLDRTTHKTDFMVWAGPAHIVDGRPIGRDDTLMHLKFEGNGNLALAYRLSRFYSTLGLDVGKFRMSGSAQRGDCSCSYHTHGDEIEVSTSGSIRQTWVSDKMGVVASVVAKMDDNGQAATGKVTASFDKVRLERPVVSARPTTISRRISGSIRDGAHPAVARQSGWEPILIVALDPAVRHPIEAHRARRRTSCLSPGRGVFHRATNPHLLPDKPWGATSKSLIGLNPSLSLNQRVPGSSPGRPPSKLSIAAGALYHHGIIIHGPCL
jgi:hypothetical protein